MSDLKDQSRIMPGLPDNQSPLNQRMTGFASAWGEYAPSDNIVDRRGMPGDMSAYGLLERLFGTSLADPVQAAAFMAQGFMGDPQQIQPHVDRILAEHRRDAATQTPPADAYSGTPTQTPSAQIVRQVSPDEWRGDYGQTPQMPGSPPTPGGFRALKF